MNYFKAILLSIGILAGSSHATDTIKHSEVIKFSDLEWIPLNPNEPFGVAMATLWGDPYSTSYGALLRVPAGFESPMHIHSFGERIVQIKGTSIHWEPGESRAGAPILQVGDYFSMPANRPHVSATLEEESIELIIQDGPFNFQLQQLK